MTIVAASGPPKRSGSAVTRSLSSSCRCRSELEPEFGTAPESTARFYELYFLSEHFIVMLAQILLLA